MMPLSRRVGAARPLLRPVLLLLVLLCVPGAVLLAPSRAAAHALSTGSSPAADSVVLEPPTQVAIRFGEPVNSALSSIEVLGAGGKHLDSGAAFLIAGDPLDLLVALQANPGVGNYLVVWRAVSAADGQVSAGYFGFTIAVAGQPLPVAQPILGLPGETGLKGAQQNDPAPSLFSWLLRGIALICFALILGGALFTALLLEGDEATTGAANRRFARIGFVLAGVLALALLGDMAAQAVAVANGGDVVAAVGQLAGATDFGRYWAAKLICALLLLAVFGWIRSRRAVPSPQAGIWNAAVALGGTYAAAEALTSSGAAIRSAAGVPVGLISAALHLVTAGAWLGGLFYLGAVLLPVLTGDNAALLERLARRFGGLSIGSIVLLAGTGLISVALHTTDPGTIAGSGFGQVLLLKHLFFLPLLLLAIGGTRRFAPALAGALGGPSNLLRGQMALAALGLLVTAGLSLLPPPVSAATNAVALQPTPGPTATPRPPAPPVTVASNSRGLNVELETIADPAGDQFRITLKRTDATAPALTTPMIVRLRVTPQDYEGGTTALLPQEAGEPSADTAVFTATEPVLIQAGGYVAAVEVQRSGAGTVLVAFRLALDDSGTLTAGSAPAIHALLDTLPSPAISGTVTLQIRLFDGEEQPITNADVGITALMPAHGHVEPDIAATPVSGQPGVYSAQATMQMGGSWLVIISVTLPGQAAIKTDATFDVLDPAEPGPS